MTRKPRPEAPGSHLDTASMIRVDHAGEYGAVRIYQGQLAVLERRATTGHSAETIRHMAAQEQRHLKAFDALVNTRHVRPTALEPVWRIAGFALGVGTALMGEKAAFACTAAVEEAIDEHYASQIAALGETDDELKATVTDFRADEAAHRATAIAEGAEQTPGYRLLSGAIKAGCRMAIKLSEKI
ncbi:MAG TPA: demethoxyubiquinone hydroxylase family protein [Rhizomicrobium sp.]|nr:demethoxyubiquinone hydroxylase family protein [Rhizomicrobium sp.]